MLALIDSDIICYRVGFTTNNEDLAIAHFRVDEMIDNILVETKADEFQLWLSDTAENNFRFKLSPSYKATRKLEKPVHHEAIKEYLITKWKAKISYGMEADDALGIEQCKYWKAIEGAAGEDGDNYSVICTIDKDLKQIPGWNYNFIKKEMSFITPEKALYEFYRSILVGDTADNIKGCKGIGPVKADRLLEGKEGEQALFSTVFLAYDAAKHHKDDLLLAGRLLKIKQSIEEPLWSFPK